MGNRSTSEILFCDNLEAIYALTEAGYAFAMVPDLPQTRIPNLRYIPLSDAKPLSSARCTCQTRETRHCGIFSASCLRVFRTASKGAAPAGCEIQNPPFVGVTER